MRIGTSRRRAAGWSVALLLTAALALAGCSAVFQQPRVHLTGVSVGGIGLRGATVVAKLAVVNPNRFDVEAGGFTYDLEVSDPGTDGGWAPFAEGRWDERVRIASGDSATVEVPIEFGYAELGGAIRSLLDRGTFDYRVEGRVDVRDPVRRTVPYRHEGTFTMDGGR